MPVSAITVEGADRLFGRMLRRPEPKYTRSWVWGSFSNFITPTKNDTLDMYDRSGFAPGSVVLDQANWQLVNSFDPWSIAYAPEPQSFTALMQPTQWSGILVWDPVDMQLIWADRNWGPDSLNAGQIVKVSLRTWFRQSNPFE